MNCECCEGDTASDALCDMCDRCIRNGAKNCTRLLETRTTVVLKCQKLLQQSVLCLNAKVETRGNRANGTVILFITTIHTLDDQKIQNKIGSRGLCRVKKRRKTVKRKPIRDYNNHPSETTNLSRTALEVDGVDGPVPDQPISSMRP